MTAVLVPWGSSRSETSAVSTPPTSMVPVTVTPVASLWPAMGLTVMTLSVSWWPLESRKLYSSLSGAPTSALVAV